VNVQLQGQRVKAGVVVIETDLKRDTWKVTDAFLQLHVGNTLKKNHI
jgi:hypothetical protein